MIFGRVRGSTVLGMAVALSIGVASGWILSGTDQSEAGTTQESWLFSHTADSGEIRERADGSLELVLRSIDEQVTAFTDRPFRDAKIEPVEWLVSSWDEFFADSPPNAVLVEHDPEGATRSVVLELTSPQLSGDELTYAVTVLEALPEGSLSRVAGVPHENPVRSFRAASLFIDDVGLTCAQGGVCAVGDSGPGGGVVFYVDGSGKYLEAARSDLPARFQWADAVTQAQSYQGGGKSDWYLPNKDELNKLYIQRFTVGNFGSDVYWTSSAVNSVIARFQIFNNGIQSGYQGNAAKTVDNLVRPIRAG